MHPSVYFVFFVSLVSFGCSSGSHDVDATSKEALQKAPPIQYGCTYTEESSNYVDGNSIGANSRPMCSMGKRCSEVGSPDDDIGGYAGGSTYRTSSSYAGKTDFVGTCDAPRPISCDDYDNGDACDQCLGKSCCSPAFLCEHDPNCKAIVDCVSNCKNDAACTQRCADNGEPSAFENLRALAKCLSGACASACGN